MSDTLTPERIAELRTRREMCWSGHHPEYIALLDAAEERASLRAKLNREASESALAHAKMQNAWAKENHEICQALGKALGYPWFKDDQKNFPDSTEADGVCVGEHVAVTIAMEAASHIATLRAEHDSALAERDNLRQLLDDACEDEDEIHRRLDAALPPDTMLTVEPLMGGRTPLCGDDGRVAQLVAENARLRDLLARVQVEDRWRPIDTAGKGMDDVILWSPTPDPEGPEDCIELGFWNNVAWDGRNGWVRPAPTHWRPLPLTPAEEAELDALRKAVAMEGETP